MLNYYLQRLILRLFRNVNHPDGFPNFKTPVETFTSPYAIVYPHCLPRVLSSYHLKTFCQVLYQKDFHENSGIFQTRIVLQIFNFEFSFVLSLQIFLCNILTLVIKLFTSGKTDFYFRLSILKIYLQRYQSITFFCNGT